MSLAAEHGQVTRTRVSEDALHQAGLADAGFPLDGQHRRPPLAELTDYSRRQAEFGLPPHEPLCRGHPSNPPHAQSFPPSASVQRRPLVSVCVSFTPSATVHRWSCGSCLRSPRTVENAGQHLWESVLGQPIRSSNLLSSATLTCGDTDRGGRCPDTSCPGGLNNGLSPEPRTV